MELIMCPREKSSYPISGDHPNPFLFESRTKGYPLKSPPQNKHITEKSLLTAHRKKKTVSVWSRCSRPLLHARYYSCSPRETMREVSLWRARSVIISPPRGSHLPRATPATAAVAVLANTSPGEKTDACASELAGLCACCEIIRQ